MVTILADLRKTASEVKSRIDGEVLPPAVRSQILEAVTAGRGPQRRKPPYLQWAAASAGVLAAAAVLLFLLRSPEQSQGWYSVHGGGDCLAADNGAVTTTCEAAIEVDSDRVTLAPDSRLVREERGLRLSNGRAQFQVTKRQGGAPAFRLEVSGGTIRVLGTRFVVNESGSSGSVAVSQGRIEFTRHSGERREVGAGESLNWSATAPIDAGPADAAPEEVADASPTKPSDGQKPTQADPPMTEKQLIDRLLLLRNQRRYREAAALLRSSVGRKDLSAGVRERFAFEHAVIVADRLGKQKRACKLWRRFLRAYPKSNKRAVVKGRLARCKN
jgi:hypothetical protein